MTTVDKWSLAMSAAGVVLAAWALQVAYSQLSQANETLAAANTIQLNSEAREVADRIAAAGSDVDAQRLAFNYYGDFLAAAGYLKDRGQLESTLWTAIYVDFCQMRERNKLFRIWFTENRDARPFVDLYPTFARLHENCPN